MEHIKNNGPESPKDKSEQLSGKEKIEALLAMFGTDTARKAFIENCVKYIEAHNQAVRDSYAPATSTRRSRAVTSDPKQSVFHNKIMDAIGRLALQSLEISDTQRDILTEMHDRKVAAKIIREYVASIGKGSTREDEEEEEEKKKIGMSDTAYYHSLGKEH